ncbi:MAG TPA: ABC transporter permease subunit [Vicinamibacterales bacterium]|jgi:ABC-type transport system involved in multi-copper enzyme maturation permease subunit|nr:ABC transporter permease subunit [Vicinamibacterales bacterium]
MPIHDQGYQRYQGQRVPVGRAWWTMARMHLITAFKRRWFLLLVFAGWARFLGYAAFYIIGPVFIPQMASFAQTNPQTFRNFLNGQGFFVFLITIVLGGLIADDRRANALQLYLSKPVTRIEYILGKAAPLLILILGLTLVPALCLILLQIVFSGSVSFLANNLFLLPAITLASLVRALLSTFMILALSSLSKSRRFVAIMYAGIIFFTLAMQQVLRAITGSRAWAAIAPSNMMDVFTDWIFRVRTPQPVPVYVAVLVIVGLIALSAWILERRVRPVEIVA